jgi:hypothetical protein
VKKLPKTFRGVAIMRGKGLHHKKFDALTDAKALDEFPNTGEFFIVITESIRDGEMAGWGRVFAAKADAVKYARACACGNVDHRVLRCTSEVLVIATENEL